MSAFNQLIALRVNFLGVVIICALTSFITVSLVNLPFFRSVEDSGVVPNSRQAENLIGKSVLDCTSGVYSPVQHKCVPQMVFDEEMQRLFSALGLDTQIYQRQGAN